MTKALVMFSWWLDSLLAIHILKKQWIKVTGLTFVTPFFGKDKAEKQAKKFGIDFMAVDISDPHWEVVQNPRYGYGKHVNPCIDCHGFMFRTAGKIADEQWYGIIASGEVLWQRPMSQNKQALDMVRKLAGRDVLRPMSAKLLGPTSYEEEWLVDREQLFDIQWRWRHRQIELAEEWGLEWYTSPGGGCLLTQWWYADKLKELMKEIDFDLASIDSELIKRGRLKFLENNGKKYFLVMWRNQEDNAKLQEIYNKLDDKYISVELDQIPGPVVVVKTLWEQLSDEFLGDLEGLFRKYVKRIEDQEIKFNIK